MNSSEKEGTTNKILLSLDLNCERWQQLLRRCFETLFVDPCLFIAIQLCWNFKPYCFCFPKSALLNWGCGLSTDAAYTQTFTVNGTSCQPFTFQKNCSKGCIQNMWRLQLLPVAHQYAFKSDAYSKEYLTWLYYLTFTSVTHYMMQSQ